MSKWQNAVHLFSEQAKEKPNELALWCKGETVTFAELSKLAARLQSPLRASGASVGDAALLVEPLSPRMYAAVLALMGLGVTVIFVEPWMKVERIEKILALVQPKYFLSGIFGQLWSWRSSSLRKIPFKISLGTASDPSMPLNLTVVDVADDLAALLTFTSGTTGEPKGVVRTHGYLRKQLKALDENLHLSKFTRPDLCIFANFALANLAMGRASLLVPSRWTPDILNHLDALPTKLQPETSTCGPAFLRRICNSGLFTDLKSVHVGGALTDCGIFENAFEQWSDCEFTHIYGSSEAEPVAVGDARRAVEISRSQGFFQTLCLGKVVPQIRSELTADTVWVTGDHVAPFYLGARDENAKAKKKDEEGRVWHNMGDRIRADGELWFYAGREQQRWDEFQIEQKIYSHLQSSQSFVHRDSEGLKLFGEGLKPHKLELLRAFPELCGVVNCRIRRDSRHRARIDRPRSRGDR